MVIFPLFASCLPQSGRKIMQSSIICLGYVEVTVRLLIQLQFADITIESCICFGSMCGRNVGADSSLPQFVLLMLTQCSAENFFPNFALLMLAQYTAVFSFPYFPKIPFCLCEHSIPPSTKCWVAISLPLI
jgi:hypothetical protein